MALSSNTPPSIDKLVSLFPLFLILALAFFVRLYVFFHTSIINPDGTIYVHQARTLAYGQWDEVTSCAMGSLSIYPVLIWAAHYLFRHWVFAATSVSLFFGTAVLVPAYLLLRRFFDKNITLVSTLILALIPVMVTRSADIVRGPIAWFFALCGLYFFVRHLDERKRLFLALSCVTFLLAAWARVEFSLFIGVSVLYLSLSGKRCGFDNLLWFVSPVLILALLGLFVLLLLDVNIGNSFRINSILTKLSSTLASYKNLRADLSALVNQPIPGPLELFLAKARNLVWFVALGTLVVYIKRAFFYPFFFIFLVGITGIGPRIGKDGRIAYATLLSICTALLLYVHILDTWVVGPRFMVLFILASLPLLGYGLEKIISFFRSTFKLSPRLAFSLVCIFVLAFGLPKNLKSRENDKLVFRQIGEYIAQREGNDRAIQVAASLHIVRWISFYANLAYRGAPCPQPYGDFQAFVGANYEEFMRNIRNKGVKYFLWEEKHWPTGSFDFVEVKRSKDFEELSTWSHPDTGRMVLYLVH